MTAEARTIAIIVAIILIVFAICLSALLHTEDAEDIVIGLAEQVDSLAHRAEILGGRRAEKRGLDLPGGRV